MFLAVLLFLLAAIAAYFIGRRAGGARESTDPIVAPPPSAPPPPPTPASGTTQPPLQPVERGGEASGSDLEALRETADALRQSEARTRAIVERAAFGIFRSTPDGRFVDVNPALAAMLGYAGTTALEMANLLTDVFADEGERRRFQSDIASDQVGDWYDVLWRRVDGATIRVRLAVRMERDAQRRPMHLLGMAENVTERLRREEVVRRGERMAALGRTLAGVAHEINNPLAAVIGFAQILLKREQPADDRHALETILHESRRAARIVKDLLAIARREETAQREHIDLNAVVRYIVDTQRYAMETHGVHAVVSLVAPPDPPFVLGDAAQLEQVVLNLIVNARQALEDPGDEAQPTRDVNGEAPTVRVVTRLAGSNVQLEVSDNGPGIADADLPHIWDPFWTTKEEGEGSGLGLSVVLGIVTSHGGTIDVSSRTVGSEREVADGEGGTGPRPGTQFVVTLPLARSPRGDDEVAPSRPAPSDKARPALDVLIVDDEAVIRELLSRYLTSRGHAVVGAKDGAHALRLAEQSTFDVVISDLRMPGMDGREVIRRLRTLPNCRDTRFILSTGDAAASPASPSHAESPDVAIVHKPYDVDALLQIVERR